MGQNEKSAIVTGGGRGIGRAISLALARAGCRVAILDILAENAQAVKQEIESLGGEALVLRVDLTKSQEVQAAAGEVLARFGQLDILVNNAGWDKLEPFLDSEEKTWERVIDINFKAILYTCKAVLPHMVSRGSGKVINIASDAGRVGSTGEAVYAGTKGAVIAFSKAIAREMARYQITVNVVCPGLTETPLLQEVRATSERANKVVDAVTRAIPLGRVGAPEDIAKAVAFLASPEADYITGQTLSVSGGLTMC
ncbi:MAG: 2-hydroxycyclohexanecarboxyl-CoA dehydrogenase [Acidobacteria bacterium RIFCSPLOWO2_12_FULL_60_22]|nr:MAG: 2-hydroxycyclohexanecarboxyl-CoA dehydrogenase [Acidobacteria bacterium RIFCSPLOWO2_12_FULL_60_22]